MSSGPGYGMRNGPGGMGMKPYGGHNWNGNMGGDRGSGGMHCVHMRGLPFKATQQDVADVIKLKTNHIKTFITFYYFSSSSLLFR